MKMLAVIVFETCCPIYRHISLYFQAKMQKHVQETYPEGTQACNNLGAYRLCPDQQEDRDRMKNRMEIQ